MSTLGGLAGCAMIVIIVLAVHIGRYKNDIAKLKEENTELRLQLERTTAKIRAYQQLNLKKE